MSGKPEKYRVVIGNSIKDIRVYTPNGEMLPFFSQAELRVNGDGTSELVLTIRELFEIVSGETK